MRISLITVAFNAEKTIEATLKSVASQTYTDLEHIVIDGASKDRTMKIVRNFPHVTKIVSEQDRGMYDALNKGLKLATGEYIGTLNADDKLHDDSVIQSLASEIKSDQQDVYFGDIRFVKKNDPSKTLRYYSSAKWHPSRFARGYMPAHPSCFVKRELFGKFGNYQTDYQIAADYELLIRFLHTHKASYRYLPILFTDMLPGGKSNHSFRSRYVLNKEIVRGCRENGIDTSLVRLSLKYFHKVFEYLPTK